MSHTTKRSTKPDTSMTAAAEAEITELAARLYGNRDCDALLKLSLKLVGRCNDSQEMIEQLRELHETLKAKCDAITSPAHHQVIINAISNNGQLMVEVAMNGGARAKVAVDPDIDPERLRIGAIGWLTRERNCLIDVSDNDGCWRDVAQFENYLDQGSQVLLKERDNFAVAGVADRLKGVNLQKGDLVGYDREVRLAYQRLESPDKQYLFDENVTGSFDDLVGLETTIALIKNLIGFRLQHSDIAAAYELPDRHGILIHGPPGNGKTHLARCAASYVKQLQPDQPCRFMHVAGSADYTMWFGETERKIIERFTAAREAARSGSVVLFFDEVDAIGRSRGSDYGSGAPDRILNTLLAQLDGVSQDSGIIVIAATNRPDSLDEALTRPGRLNYKIELGKPHRRTAAAILRHYLGRWQAAGTKLRRFERTDFAHGVAAVCSEWTIRGSCQIKAEGWTTAIFTWA